MAREKFPNLLMQGGVFGAENGLDIEFGVFVTVETESGVKTGCLFSTARCQYGLVLVVERAILEAFVHSVTRLSVPQDRLLGEYGQQVCGGTFPAPCKAMTFGTTTDLPCGEKENVEGRTRERFFQS